MLMTKLCYQTANTTPVSPPNLSRLRTVVTVKADSHIACRAHAVPLPRRAAKGLECLSHLIYTVRPCLIHTGHAMLMPMPCSDHGVLLKATAQHGRLSTAVLCSGLEKNGVVGAWHGKCGSDTAALCKSNGKDTF